LGGNKKVIFSVKLLEKAPTSYLNAILTIRMLP